MKWFFGGGVLLAILLLVSAALVPAWGERHTANPAKSLLVTTAHPVEQQFTTEYQQLTQIAIWLVPQQAFPSTGGLALQVKAGTKQQLAFIDFKDVQADGLAVFSLPSPLSVTPHTAATFQIQLHDTNAPIKIGYQNDGTKYADGAVTGAAGDTAFQVHYNTSPLPHVWLWALVLAAAALWILWQWRTSSSVSFYTKKDYVWAGVGGIIITAFFAAFLVWPPGQWNSPGDFTKDVSYLQAAHVAFRQLSWPTWSQLSCGGLPLLGNPESNSLSLGSILAFFTSPQNALLWLVSLEAGIGAIGVFLLARALGIHHTGSIVAGIISALAGGYAYRLLEGFTMTGGAVAYMPWVLLGFFWYIKKQSWAWLWISGSALGLLFLRGEVHILAGLVFLLGILVIAISIRQKSWLPVVGFITLSCVGLVWASPKLLAYGEYSSVFQQDLHPYVTLLTKDGWLSDVFFKLYPSDKTIGVLHGKGTERWGNFGSFVGLLSVCLAVGGLFSKNKYRWWLLASALGIFFIAEGTLYEYALRYLPELGVLLRLPTRLLSIFVIPFGLLAGMGVEWLVSLLPLAFRKPAMVIILLAVVLDLGIANSSILSNSVRNRTYTTLPVPAQPMVHQSYSNQLLASGYLLPQLCADFMNPPAFAHPATESWPLTTTPAQLGSNTITLSNTNTKNEFILQSRFNDHWQATGATVLEGPDSTLLLATTASSPATVTLQFADSVNHAEAMLFFVMLVTTVGLGLFPVGLEYFRKFVW